jgi:FAD synthase
MYILNKKNNTLEEEFKLKYIDLKNELINYRNNNTYLKYEREAIEKIKELEIEKKIFEDFEKNINEKNQKDFQEEELKNLTDLIDRYILSEN